MSFILGGVSAKDLADRARKELPDEVLANFYAAHVLGGAAPVKPTSAKASKPASVKAAAKASRSVAKRSARKGAAVSGEHRAKVGDALSDAESDGLAMPDLVKATGLKDVKVRAVLKALAAEGAAHSTGSKRSTRYFAGQAA